MIVVVWKIYGCMLEYLKEIADKGKIHLFTIIE